MHEGETSTNYKPQDDIKNKKLDEKKNKQAPSGRIKWSENEKKLVLNHFKTHIKKKIAPKKEECEQLLNEHRSILMTKDWVRIKTFVYNNYRNK